MRIKAELAGTEKRRQEGETKLLKINSDLAEKLLATEKENKKLQSTKPENKPQAEQLQKGDTLLKVMNTVQAKEIIKLNSELVVKINVANYLQKDLVRTRLERKNLSASNEELRKQLKQLKSGKPIENNVRKDSDFENTGLKKKIENYISEIRNLRNVLAKSGNTELLKKIEILKEELTRNQRNTRNDRLLRKEEPLPEKSQEESLTENGLDLFQEQNSEYIGYRCKEHLLSIIENEYDSDEEKIFSLSNYIGKK